MKWLLLAFYLYGVWYIIFKQGPKLRVELGLARATSAGSCDPKVWRDVRIKENFIGLLYGTTLRTIITAIFWPIAMVVSIFYALILIRRERKIRDG